MEIIIFYIIGVIIFNIISKQTKIKSKLSSVKDEVIEGIENHPESKKIISDLETKVIGQNVLKRHRKTELNANKETKKHSKKQLLNANKDVIKESISNQLSETSDINSNSSVDQQLTIDQTIKVKRTEIKQDSIKNTVPTMTKQSLKQAVILKEILDKPVALRK